MIFPLDVGRHPKRDPQPLKNGIKIVTLNTIQIKRAYTLRESSSKTIRDYGETVNTLIVIRHAIAEERTRFAHNHHQDNDRPLTDKGRARMAAGCAGIRLLAPAIGTLATSPWVRARQTADIVAHAYWGMSVVETDTLIPNHDPESLLAWLVAHWHNGPVAVVGHEPHLGDWLGWALHGPSGDPLPMKKGGACGLSFDATPEPGRARLDWFMSPRELRRLGGCKPEVAI